MGAGCPAPPPHTYLIRSKLSDLFGDAVISPVLFLLMYTEKPLFWKPNSFATCNEPEESAWNAEAAPASGHTGRGHRPLAGDGERSPAHQQQNASLRPGCPTAQPVTS